MRKVQICEKGYYGGSGKNEPSNLCLGVFHGWFSEGSHDEGVECYALVELPSGHCNLIQTHRIKFLDNPPKSEAKEIKKPSTNIERSAIKPLCEICVGRYNGCKLIFNSSCCAARYSRV